MASLTLTKEEAKIYYEVKQRSGAETDEDLIRWLFHDWKRLADREAQFIIQPEPPRDPYSAKGVSIDPGLRRVEHPGHEETDHLIKKIQVDPGKLGGMGGPGGPGGMG